ncbi:MAG: hypothetical protein WD651_13585 [Acidimicrobiia bacterium]
MSSPIVFISHNRLKAGMLEKFTDFYRTEVEVIKAEKPGTLTHLAYVNEVGTEVSFVHVLADADAFDAHLQGVQARVDASATFIESRGFEIYGAPTAATVETMRGHAKTNQVPLRILPDQVGGYLRLG